jgi:hypothetical protein
LYAHDDSGLLAPTYWYFQGATVLFRMSDI